MTAADPDWPPYPTDTFPVLEPQNPRNDEFYEAPKRHETDSKASKCCNGRSGDNLQYGTRPNISQFRCIKSAEHPFSATSNSSVHGIWSSKILEIFGRDSNFEAPKL